MRPETHFAFLMVVLFALFAVGVPCAPLLHRFLCERF
jgi:hypothetical protein